MSYRNITSRCKLKIEVYEPDLVWLVFEGCIDRKAMMETAASISDDGAYSYSHRVWDVRLCELDLPHEDIVQLATKSNNLQTGDSKVAVLVDRKLHFGLLRVFNGYADEGQKEQQICLDEGELHPSLRKP